MRIPVAVTLESRDGLVSKDAKMVNGILEPRGDQPLMLKRPGVADVGQVWPRGAAQLLYPWNGLWAIYGDTLFSGTQSTIITPTFGTWNPSDKGASVTLSNGNLTTTFAVSNNVMVRATLSKSVGKFYWEVTAGAIPNVIVGIAKSGATLNNYLGQDANGWGYYGFNGNKTNSAASTAFGATYTTGDVIGIALDCDNGTLTFYKNGVSQGQAFSGLSGTFFPAISGSTGAAESATVNFGATAFSYTPPSGYTAGVAALGTSLGPTAGGLRFDAQEVGASAATQLMMVKNRTQAWTIDRSGTKTLISFPSSMGAATYSVSTLTRSGSTATASLASDPGVNIGDSITVAGAGDAAYNLTTTVTAITPYSFTPGATVPLTITRSGTTATATSSSAHGLTNGASYTMSGAGQAAYNITATVTVTGTTTFTYTVTVTTYTAYGAGVTWNPSDKGAGVTLSGGNLTATITTTGGSASVRATSGMASGVHYWEVTVTADYSAGIGVANATFSLADNVGHDNNSWGYYSGVLFHGGVITSGVATYGAGDVIGILLNMDTGVVVFYKNGVPQGQYTGLTGTIYPTVTNTGGSGGTSVLVGNFGATAFSYSYDDPISPATGTPVVTKSAVTTNASVSYTVAGSPATPATGTITLTTNGGMVPGLPYIDGYFFVMDQNGVMWQSSIDAPGTWPALSNLTAQSENGKGKALNRSLNNLVAFKEWSTEFFYNAKQQNFSFLPVDNGFTEVGCASGDSVAHIDGSLAWLSQVKERGRSVHLMAGLQQQKVSTADVERILNLDDLATVYAYGIKLGGHSLYLLTLVTSNITLVYDLSAQAWYQWSSLTLGSSKSVTSITRSGTTATVTTSTAHGLSDGDPAKIAGATQNEYNGIFQISYVSATVFTIQVTGVPATPATGTITATPYTSSYFKFTKYCDYQGLNLFLHETDGHLYQMLPTLYQDAGVPIDLMFRTARLDGGTVDNKRLGEVVVVGDSIADTMMLRWSDDDCATFSVMKRVDLSLDRPSRRRGGKFRRRTFEGRHIGNTKPRIEAIELEIS